MRQWRTRPNWQKLLEEMASIETMFRGSMSKRRQGKSGGEYFAVQCWHNGRNECRYVPPARREAYERAVVGYARFMELAERYADAVIARTEREIASLLPRLFSSGPFS